MKTKKIGEKGFAISGIFLMVMSLFAFSFVLSESVVVSGACSSDMKEINTYICNLKELKEDSPRLDANDGGEHADKLMGLITDAETNEIITKKLADEWRGVWWKPTPNVEGIQSKLKQMRAITPVPPTPAKAAVETVAAPVEATVKATAPPAPDKKAPDKASTGSLKEWWGTFMKENPLLGHLAEGAGYAATVAGAIQLFGPMFGLEDKTTNALSISATIGIMTWKGLEGVTAQFGKNSEILAFFGENPLYLTNAAWIGIGVAAIAFLLLYSEESKKVVTFTCLPWQAPKGGERCEDCNKQGLPCSEYQCKSLGQSCELLNPGTGEEKCVWVNRQDVNPPTIEPWEDALLDDYRYSPDNSISPPDRGVKINYLKANDNCIPAFTPLKFGVLLNEPAKCKIDVLRKENFKEMTSFMNGGLSNYSHSYALSLPGKSALKSENITLQNNGNYEMYVRCEDANGNSNTATFVFKYCVDPGPDTTPPLIVTTSIINNGPIAYNQSSIDLEVYVNEPSNCKWSHDNQDYNSMEEEMQCLTSIFEYNAQMLYKCSTTLTGLKDRIENKFYFRCKDQPNSPESEKNTNKQSYEFNLIGTQPLVIDSVSPNDTTVSDSTDSVKVTLEVETSAGNKEGESICYYSNTGNENNYIKFFETQSFKHTQDLFLAEGDYEYYIKCTDLGGNSDYETINFDVETDSSSPLVVRVYKEENFLKLITNEESECIYSTFGCSYEFSEGTKITVVDETKHFTDWNVQTDLYVKCQDNFGNQPLPNQCSIIVRASNF